jgi:spermidine synthase
MEPSNLQSNRFFTKEFFFLVKTRLNEGGIFVLGLPGSLTYLNEELRNLNSCIYHTLKSVFSYIRVIPGDSTNLFLSSDSREILTIDTTQILARSNQRNIKADVVAPWYIEKKLHHGWQDWFFNLIEGSSQKINSDLNPVGLFYSISHWNALFAPSLRWLFRQFERIDLRTILLLFAIFLLLLFFFRSKNIRFFRTGIPLSIVTTGFAGMIFDLVLIFTFQSIHGYVFSWIGLLVASFMAGAACGAMLTTMVLARIRDCFRLFMMVELAIACFSIGCPFVFLAVHEHLGSPGLLVFRALFLVISFVCGLLIGSQFPLANKIYLGKSPSLSRTAGLLYASDLLGGWFGGIIGAVLLLPVLGLAGTCVTVGLLKLTSFIVITTQPDRHL